MKIFDSKTFWEFLGAYLRALPNRGHGELRKISAASGIHTTTLSQAIKGNRPFSLEQIEKICDYLGLSELETKFALAMHQHERAGTERLRKIFASELESLKEKSTDLSHVLNKEKLLTDSEKAVFYSNWYYTAIAVLSSIEGNRDVAALSSRLHLSKRVVNQAVEFLLNTGICVKRDGLIEPGTKSTHLDSGSPLLNRHHGNWRIRAMNRHPNLQLDKEICYSSPMSLSQADAAIIRSMLVSLVKQVNEIRDPSPCEEAYCLNLDWFRI